MLNDSWLMDTWRASKRGHSWLPSIKEGPPLLISHLFSLQGYYTQISPLLSHLTHSSLSFLLALSIFSQACGKYLSMLASIKEIFGGHMVLRVFLVPSFHEVILFLCFLSSYACFEIYSRNIKQSIFLV
jgi:hypothetical protein